MANQTETPRCRSHPGEHAFTCRLCRSEAIANHDREPENQPVANFSNRPKTRGLRGTVARSENVVTVSFGGKP